MYNFERPIYGHRFMASTAPYSSYSALLIHICWKDPKLVKMEAPIHEANWRSTDLAQTIRHLAALGNLLDNSSDNRCSRPWCNDDAPHKTMLLQSSLRKSTSTLEIASWTRLGIDKSFQHVMSYRVLVLFVLEPMGSEKKRSGSLRNCSYQFKSTLVPSSNS